MSLFCKDIPLRFFLELLITVKPKSWCLMSDTMCSILSFLSIFVKVLLFRDRNILRNIYC